MQGRLGTYAEGLEVVDRQGVAVEMEESILEHASVAVAGEDLSEEVRGDISARDTYERTKRSRPSHLGFLGLNLMNLFQRTWATGAMPLRVR